MAAAEYRTAQAVENGNTSSLVMVVPAGASAGELAYACVSYPGTVATITADPSGWDVVESQVDGNTSVRLYSRTLQSGDPGANVTVTFSGLNKAAGTIVTVSGVHDTTAWEPLGTSLTTSLPTPSITAAADDSLVIDFLNNKNSAPANFTAPGTRTIRAQAYNTGTVNASGAGTAVIASAGTVSSVTYTQPESLHGGVLSVMVGPTAGGATVTATAVAGVAAVNDFAADVRDVALVIGGASKQGNWA